MMAWEQPGQGGVEAQYKSGITPCQSCPEQIVPVYVPLGRALIRLGCRVLQVRSAEKQLNQGEVCPLLVDFFLARWSCCQEIC